MTSWRNRITGSIVGCFGELLDKAKRSSQLSTAIKVVEAEFRGRGAIGQLQLPRGSKIMVLSAHADDEALGCLYPMLDVQASGGGVHWHVITDGRNANAATVDPEAMVNMRRGEVEKIAARLQCVENHFWGIRSPAQIEDVLVTRLAQEIARVSPTHVFAPFPYNHHPEHRMVSLMAVAAVSAAIPILFYSIQTPIIPEFVSHYSAATKKKLEDKVEVLSMYKSQHFMKRSFKAALLMQQVEGRVFAKNSIGVECFSCLFGEGRAELVKKLAAAAAGRVLPKPNRICRIATDVEDLFKQWNMVKL